MHRLRLISAHMILVVGCSSSHGVCPSCPAYDAFAPIDGGSADAFSPPDAGPDAPPVADAGPQASCDPQLAHTQSCPASLCDGLPGWYWDGEQCFAIDCGACEGADCAARYSSQDACVAAHTECRAALCRATGGTWRWWAFECHDWRCGFPLPNDCGVGGPVCDCGDNNVFGLSGCAPGPLCELRAPQTPEQLCTSTGGSWDPICCPARCGELCPLDCAALACNCGAGRIFENDGEHTRGCIEATECYERSVGQTCENGSRCGDGLLCCTACSGVGCTGPAVCRVPLCDSNPNIDECGNDLLAP